MIGDFKVTGLRYKGRNKDINGNITQYKIQVSYNGTDYEDLTTGTWADDGQWKEVTFTKPVAPTNVRLFAVTSNGGFAAAVEMRLVGEELSYAKDLNDGTIVSLKECLYTLAGTANGSYSLVHGGHYYVKPSANGNAIVHTTAGFHQITLETEWDNISDANAIRIKGTDGRVSGGGYIHFRGHEDKPYWDRCTSAHEHTDGDYNQTDSFYFFSKNKDGSGNEIPGFTMVEPADIKVGNSYLIAAKKTDNNVDTWYILCPTDSNNQYEHIAQVVSRADNEIVHVHDEKTVSSTATCVKAGVKTITCTCGHVHKVTVEATGIHTWTDATCVTPKTCSVCGATEGEPLESKNAKPLMVNWRDNNRGVVSLSDCEYVLSGTEGAYSLCHDGTYYVNSAAAVNTGIPQQTSAFAGLSLTFNEGKVKIATGDTQLQVNKVASAVNLPNVHPWWHDSKATQSDSTTDFYLLRANPDSTNTNIPGYEIVTTVTAGERYLIAFKNGANEWFVMYPSTETVALAMVVESAGEFSIDYTNITLDNDLKINFAFEKAQVDGLTGCNAVIEKGNETKTIPMGEWATTGIKGDDYYYVTFDGVAAKEMADEFSVTIYNADDVAISTTHTDSIQSYAHRVLNGSYSNEYKTVVVDMLNYGAEAQEMFNYKTGNMANANLTEEQMGFATKNVSLGNELVKTGNVEYLANVKLESNIQFMMAFTGIDPETMTATVAFTNWNGQKHENVHCRFVEGGSYHYITIEETVIADGRLPITCTIKEGDKVIATITDSIASYAARAAEKNSDNADLYQALMKFSDSAYKYLK